MHGTADNSVDFNESTILYKEAIKAKVPVEFHPIEGKGHGFKNTGFLTNKSDQGILLSEHFYRFAEQAVNQPDKIKVATCIGIGIGVIDRPRRMIVIDGAGQANRLEKTVLKAIIRFKLIKYLFE
jgi:hypothetical protein